MTTTAIQLDVSDGRPSQSELVSIQDALAELGVGIWPLDLTAVPSELRALLRQPTLSEEDPASSAPSTHPTPTVASPLLPPTNSSLR